MSDATHLDAALEYARGGMAVFPGHSVVTDGRCTCGRAKCSSPGKHPRIREWQQKASTNELRIREWWKRWPEANICIATGQASGVVVLDVDPRHHGDRSLQEFESVHGSLPSTPVCRTGGGGCHFYFLAPNGAFPNKANVLPGLDIRGDGGYVVAPPSLHVSGERYQWTTAPQSR